MPYCEKCNHTGLVPSKALGKFSGKPIPGCFSDCECKQDFPESYHIVEYDFACSETFRDYEAQLNGIDLPSIVPQAVPEAPQPIFRPRPVDKDIEQLKAGLLHLQNKLNESIKRNPSNRYQRYK